MLQHVATCCSVLQCVAACCNVLQRVAIYRNCSVLQDVAMCCNVSLLRHTSVCRVTGSLVYPTVLRCNVWHYVAICFKMLQDVARCCNMSLLRHTSVCTVSYSLVYPTVLRCNVLQYVAMCCIVSLQHHTRVYRVSTGLINRSCQQVLCILLHGVAHIQHTITPWGVAHTQHIITPMSLQGSEDP